VSRPPKSVEARIDRLALAGEVEGAGPTPPRGAALVEFSADLLAWFEEPLPPLPGEQPDPERAAARRADLEAFRVALANYVAVLSA
jgi:hypothetical protein